MTTNRLFRSLIEEKKSRFAFLVLSVLAAGLSACDEKGTYSLEWQFSDVEITDPNICTQRGVASIRISAYKAGTQSLSRIHRFSCFPPDRAARLDPGTYDLKIEGLSAMGLPFVDPVTSDQYALGWITGLQIKEGKTSSATVVLARAPRCLDSVDNDGDGLVDALDPGCWEVDSKGYLVLDEQGRHTYMPTYDDETDPESPPKTGSIDLTWTVRGLSDGCGSAGPQGASWVSVRVNQEPETLFPCADGGALLPMVPGTVHLESRLLDDAHEDLSVPLTSDATVVENQATPVSIDFSALSLLKGTLTFTLSWETDGGECQDATPFVAEQGVLLEDPVSGLTLDATLMPLGTPTDGSEESFGACVDPAQTLTISPDLPTGLYQLTIEAREALGEICWSGVFTELGVAVGDPLVHDLVVNRASTTGNCTAP